MFYPTKDLRFGNLGGSGYKGGIGSGVLQATKMLIDTYDVDSIGFNTDDDALIRLYDTLVPFLERKLSLQLINTEKHRKMKSYQFKVVK